MLSNPAASIGEHFSNVEDPRIERTKLHKLIDILTIAICAVICGADNWEEIQLFGEATALTNQFKQNQQNSKTRKSERCE